MTFREILAQKPLRPEHHLSYWKAELQYWTNLPKTWAIGHPADWLDTAKARVMVCEEMIHMLSQPGHNQPIGS